MSAQVVERLPLLPTYVDDGVSGWDPNKLRPSFERLLADIAARRIAGPVLYARLSKRGQQDGAGSSLGIGRQLDDCGEYAARLTRAAVVAWHADRLTRQPLQLELLWQACQRAGVELHTVRGGHVEDPTMLRIEGALAWKESAQKSARVTRKLRELAVTGKASGGQRRFGYEPGMAELRPVEADAVRVMAQRLLAGESVASCVRWLDAQGIATARGGAWSVAQVSRLMVGPHLAAKRVHRGEVVGAGAWPAILTEQQHDALVALFGDPSRRTSPGNRSRYLLSMLATCGTCGAQLKGQPGTRDFAHPMLKCPTHKHVARKAEPVDSYVADVIVERLRRLTPQGLLSDDSAQLRIEQLLAEQASLTAKLDRLDQQAVEGAISEDTLNRRTRLVEQQLAGIAAAIAAENSTAQRGIAELDGMVGLGARQAWEEAGLGRQRAVIARLCEVSLTSAGRGVRFDPRRDVTITWRQL